MTNDITKDRKLRTLIIEDDKELVRTYESYFRQFARTLCTDTPVYATCFTEALQLIRSHEPYDVVILDLGLPEDLDGDAEDGHLRGVNLIGALANRDESPIPTLLLISGNIHRTQLAQLNRELDGKFFYSAIITKSGDYKAEISAGIEKAFVYRTHSIRMLDGASQYQPHLTAREEDLLRRATLLQSEATGVELQRWGIEFEPRRPERPDDDKVFLGRCLLGAGRGQSAYTFFKFEPTPSFMNSRDSAKVMEQILPHVRVMADIKSENRGLLVTTKIGSSSHKPLSLTEMLGEPVEEIGSRLYRIAADIAEQVGRLGNYTSMEKRPYELLWKWHKPETIEAGWRKICANFLTTHNQSVIDPATFYRALLASQAILNVDVQGYQHGDLHAGNVAYDPGDGDGRAFIFDPGNMASGIFGRDQATLEISLMLHQKYDGPSLVSYMSELYSGARPHGIYLPPLAPSDRHQNNLLFINEIRAQVHPRCSTPVYALMLMDYVLIQIGGLATEYSQNKIFRNEDVVETYRLLAQWVTAAFSL